MKDKERNLTMMTDLYELTMSQAYLKQHKENDIAVFDIFFRKNPFNKGYGIMGGLHEVIEFIKQAHFDDEDIEYLRSKNIFDEEFLQYLKGFKFHGDIFAIPDGTPVFANEPVLTVKAPLIEAQIVETI
ncbi:MAG: nicotinate phosphoribosyltransferase, partial [Bacilli bacterium]|nr:nicotinate phosphoribosyltransferase [Bacilli bacterium]